MKKKILIMMNNMRIGGVEKALLNILTVIDKDKFDITILFIRKDGEYLKEIPSWVKIEEIEISDLERNILDFGPKVILLETLKKYKYASTAKVALLALKRKVTLNILKNIDEFKVLFKFLPKYKGKYDLAIDFHQTYVTTYYISEKVSADYKIAWLHSSDFGENLRNLSQYYSKFNRVFGVSKACVDKYNKLFPEHSGKCKTFYNIILTDDIKRMAEQGEGFGDSLDGIRILTVGRLSYAKGYDVAISVAAKLKEDGFKFKWYVIGDGIERTKLEKLIDQYEVRDCFILLGSLKNPYPYINQCDIYVQPSRFEGYCIALAEARILNKPIIATNFFGAEEQIINGETGLIINFNEDNIYEAIKKLIINPLLRLKFEENLSRETINSSLNEMKKLYALVDD